jgi:cytidine deaminase
MLDEQTAADLLREACAATEYAYVPYSTFPVGAALLTADGETVRGCNIENASYGLTVCAERAAVFSAVAAGAREITAIAVVASNVEAVTPCGACRQVLNEFGPAEGELIVILERDGRPEQIPLSDLLPRAFGPRQLDRP